MTTFFLYTSNYTFGMTLTQRTRVDLRRDCYSGFINYSDRNTYEGMVHFVIQFDTIHLDFVWIYLFKLFLYQIIFINLIWYVRKYFVKIIFSGFFVTFPCRHLSNWMIFLFWRCLDMPRWHNLAFTVRHYIALFSCSSFCVVVNIVVYVHECVGCGYYYLEN